MRKKALGSVGRTVILHGHFYQPPRENPWTGEVEAQLGAAPDHDWNERIARQCYNPNGAAAIADGAGNVLERVNNYAFLSFDFGPTLLAWYEKAFPGEYARILEADRLSAKRLAGHGNAMAHPYAHAILPLSTPRDIRTNLLWGLADFRFRFGRSPEAFWLPETAVSAEVLSALIGVKAKYAILAPHQAAKARPLGSRPWTDAKSGGLEPGRAYRWFDGRGRHLDLFFYHGGLSRAVAFDRLLADSGKACAEVEAALPDPPGPGLALAAVDGETFGHHHPFADMGLAHLFQHRLPHAGLAAVNPGWALARHSPTHEVAADFGADGLGTSWSCAHGTGRWRADCGCGREAGRQQRWRAPLREALESLREKIDALYERAAGRFLKDPWEAREDYIRVLLEPGPGSRADLLRRHAKARISRQAREGVWPLLEMQRQSLLMFTSCGWFFSDMGIEAAQNLRHAGRAMDLAREASGIGLEADFLRLLELAPSNDPAVPTARALYERWARPLSPA